MMAKLILIFAFSLSVSKQGFGQNDTVPLKTTDTLTTSVSTVQTVQTDTALNINVTPSVEADGPVYKLKPAVDLPITLPATAWTLYAFGKIYDKDPSTDAQINRLSKNDLNGFDRWAAGYYSEKAKDASDLLFYGSMPLPVLFLLDKHTRKDIPKLTFLYIEALSVTGLLYTGSTYLVDRYRPYTYNQNTTEVSYDKRKSGNSKNSFFAGHVALVGTSTFFMAKVFADYHPESKAKWVFYGLAAAATGATGYLRHRAGMHFPSDIIIGTAVGTLSGILVPHFHRNKLLNNPNLSIVPFTGNSHGLAFIYKLK